MSGAGDPTHEVRDQRGDSAIAMSAGGAWFQSLTLIAVAMAAAWGLTYLWGGSKTVGPQIFYAPILIAATRFGHGGALVTGVVAGVACGPLMPLDVDLGLDQETSNWVARLVAFVLIGQVVAALHLRSLPLVQRRIDARHFRQKVLAAVDAGEIRPVFQPLVDLESGRIVGLEALARWYPSGGGELAPADFIPEAEEAGIVGAIDLEILRRAAAQLAEWRATEVVDGDTVFLTVNVSGQAFEDPRLVERIADALDGAGLAPQNLVVEVTETALIEDHVGAAERMAGLQAVGVRLALDDFGVGQSSLAALHRYPIDVIKLDRSFLAMLGGEERGLQLLRAVVQLASGLARGLVIVEGIETPAHLGGVVAVGCRHGQGYFFDRPLDVQGTERALRAGGYQISGSSPPDPRPGV
ncbi:MAG: EAL domain-containing protein [Acidimicrobiales bacterium]